MSILCSISLELSSTLTDLHKGQQNRFRYFRHFSERDKYWTEITMSLVLKSNAVIKTVTEYDVR